MESGPLAGITRALTIEWCREEGLEVREEVLPLSVLATADEIFITSSTRDIQAVGTIRVVPTQQTLAGERLGVDLAEREPGNEPGSVPARAAGAFPQLGPQPMEP